MTRRLLVSFFATALVVAGLAGPASAADPTFSWGMPKLGVDNIQGAPDTISCVSVDFCVAGDSQGSVVVRNANGWRRPHQLRAGAISSISCVSTQFCMAMGYNGSWSDYDGVSWSTPQVFAGYPYDQLVSCASESFCIATNYTGSRSQVLTWDGSAWAGPVQVDPASAQIAAVDCLSTTFCIIGDNQGNVLTYDGTTWSAPTKAIDDLTQLSCTSAQSCVATADDGRATFLRGGAWSAPQPIAAGFVPTALSCDGSGFCLATDGTTSYRLTGTAVWKGPSVLPEASASHSVGCFAPSTCRAEQVNGDVETFSGGRWRSPRLIDVPAGGVRGITCASLQFCALWDDHGAAYVSSGLTWTKHTFPRLLTSISCPADGFCIAVGGHDEFTYANGHWHSGSTISTHALRAVSCASASFCVAGASHGEVVMFDGTTWSAPQQLSGDYAESPINSVSCPDVTFCLANSEKGAVSSFDGTAWSELRKPKPIRHHNPHGVTCTSSIFCMARDGKSYRGPTHVIVYDGSRWMPHPVHVVISMPSCSSPTFCVASTHGGYVQWDGTAWSDPTPFAYGGDLSCVPGDSCVAVDAYGDVTKGRTG